MISDFGFCLAVVKPYGLPDLAEPEPPPMDWPPEQAARLAAAASTAPPSTYVRSLLVLVVLAVSGVSGSCPARPPGR